MKHLLVVLFFFASVKLAQGQVLLNPSFENTNAPPCAYNLSNSSFNLLMLNVSAFGTYENCDIISNSCGYGQAYHGNWFVGLSVPPAANTGDAISLELSSPMMPGQTYLFGFYQKKDTAYDANYIEVGYSASPSAQGTVAAVVSLPLSTAWTYFSAQITPAVPSPYITLGVIPAQYGWNHIDSLSLTQVTAIPSFGDTTWTVHPNPADDCVALTGLPAGSIVRVEMFDFTGRVVAVQTVNKGSHSALLDVSGLAKGVYTVTMRSGDYAGTRKLFKN